MRNHSSRTATYTTLARALETARPRPRLFEDPYAARFLGLRLLARLAAVPPVSRAIERSIDRKYPAGHRGNAVVRTRVIDDLVSAALADGMEQVVLLGAGFDSRAYRMPAMRQVAVFEVDHPATQAEKVARVTRYVPPGHREHVRFVPVDLQRDSLDAALGEAGFRPARTAVIWEGVTSYLDAESVDATIRWMAGSTTTGSRLIFTYLEEQGLHAPTAGTGSGAVADAFRDVGEPMTYGLDPRELAGYLSARGLTLIEDLSTSEAAERYLRPLGRHDHAGAFSHIALAGKP